MPLNEMMAALRTTRTFFLTQLERISSQSIPQSVLSDTNLSASHNMEKLTDQKLQFFSMNVHIFSHLDTDGLSAAAILAQTLKRAKIGYQITILRQLEVDYIKHIAEECHQYQQFAIFADFGTGQIELLYQYMQESDFLVLDHHRPIDQSQPPRINHINPYFYQIRGENEISGAGVCYLFAIIMDPLNTDLVPLAILGAIGDMQNKQDRGQFLGVNTQFLDEAIRLDQISVEVGLGISRSRPLGYALAFTLIEKIDGITGDIDTAFNFLERNNIRAKNELNEERTYQNLTDLEKKTLNSALIQYALIQKKMNVDTPKKLITTNFFLKQSDPNSPASDMRELSSLINACGRTGKHALGIATLLGDRDAMKNAIEETKNYKRDLSKAFQLAKSNLREHSAIYTTYDAAINEKIIGSICTMLVYSEIPSNKPLFAYADSDKHTLKFSARANPELVTKGLDLGFIMREVCNAMNITDPAGGHAAAAGAKINAIQLKEFIDKINAAVENQLKKTK